MNCIELFVPNPFLTNVLYISRFRCAAGSVPTIDGGAMHLSHFGNAFAVMILGQSLELRGLMLDDVGVIGCPPFYRKPIYVYYIYIYIYI